MGGAPGGSKMGRNIGIGCVVILLLTCFCGIGWQVVMRMMMANVSVSPDGTIGAATGGDVCGRAAACCQAYVQALGPAGASASGACAAYTSGAPGMEATCQQGISTYAQSIQALGQPVPAACQ